MNDLKWEKVLLKGNIDYDKGEEVFLVRTCESNGRDIRLDIVDTIKTHMSAVRVIAKGKVKRTTSQRDNYDNYFIAEKVFRWNDGTLSAIFQEKEYRFEAI